MVLVTVFIQIPRIKQPIPLFVVFRALGIISDKSICEYILINIEDTKLKKMLFALKASLIDANMILTQDDAMEYITNFVNFTPINMSVELANEEKNLQKRF